MNNIFGREGCLNGILPFYEYRSQQHDMASFLSDFFTDGGVSFVEAGTGTGKSLAYLVPAIEHCLSEGKVLAVSTETKALQKQLFDKDLPLVQEIFRREFDTELKYSLCLGSANYPCTKRFETLVQRGGFLFGEQEEISNIAELIESGKPFSRFDVKVSPMVWRDIERDSDICFGNDCLHFQRCPFQKIKKEWFTSHILVMNHYLFFSNTATGYTYLPNFDCVIFDEAHSVESIASKQLGFDISWTLLFDILERFHHPNKKLIVARISDKTAAQTARRFLNEIQIEGRAFFDSLMKSGFSSKRTARIREPISEGEMLSNLIAEFLFLLKQNEADFKDEQINLDYESAKSKLSAFLEALNLSLKKNPDNMVLWTERSDAGSISICGSPVEIAELMKENVLPRFESSVFVSATLSIGKDFSFIAGRLGAENPRTLALDSPFDYESRVLLYTPTDLPAPNDRGFNDAGAERCAELIAETGGNTLILFTSYEMLREFETRISGMVNVKVFSQSGGDASRVVSEYIETPGSVLLGTHSYWQGLDLPGDLVRCVIITKLPFPVPDRPDIEAKSDVIKKNGAQPFSALHLPSAVIQFKQGFGRLMRRTDDKGVIAVLDNRIIQKNYGRAFLQAIPRCRHTVQWPDVKRFAERMM